VASCFKAPPVCESVTIEYDGEFRSIHCPYIKLLQVPEYVNSSIDFGFVFINGPKVNNCTLLGRLCVVIMPKRFVFIPY